MSVASTIAASAPVSSYRLTDFESALDEDFSGQWLDRLAEVARRSSDLYSLAWFGTSPTKCISHHLPGAENLFEQALFHVAEECRTTRGKVTVTVKAVAQPSGLKQSFTLIAIPVEVADDIGVLAGVFLDDAARFPHNMDVMQSIAGAVRLHRIAAVAEQAQEELVTAAAIIDIIARLESCESQLAACQRLAEDLAKHTHSTFAVVGVIQKSNQACRLTAVSDQSSISLDAERRQAFEAALEEIVVRDTTTVWPAESKTRRHGLLTHSRLGELLGAESVLGTPIRLANGTVIGACLLCGSGELRQHVGYRRFIEVAGQRVGAALWLVRRAEHSSLRRLLRKLGATSDSPQKRTMLLSAALLVACLTLRTTFDVSCDCELQPALRRYVAVPFEGTLDTSLVEPGETVTAGQLLARMDPREINWELAGVDAEQQRAAKERDTNLAKQDIGAAELARHDVERLKTRHDLLLHRNENLEIRSPIDGLVIAGDWKKSEGIPMKTGERLFEIAPLNVMLIEVAIPEADIRHVIVGQEVSIVLTAFPGERMTGTVRRIHPRSEIRDESHVFIADVELPNADGRLRPGMKGSAHIATGKRMLGWILLHRPVEAALLRLGW